MKKLIKEVVKFYKYIDPKGTWQNRWFYKELLEIWKDASTIQDLHTAKQHMVKHKKKLGPRLYTKLLDKYHDKRTKLLQSGGYTS